MAFFQNTTLERKKEKQKQKQKEKQKENGTENKDTKQNCAKESKRSFNEGQSMRTESESESEDEDKDFWGYREFSREDCEKVFIDFSSLSESSSLTEREAGGEEE